MIQLLVFAFFMLFAVPLSVLIHELGHALAAKRCGAQGLKIYIGSGKELCSYSIGTIKVTFHLIWMFGGATSSDIPVTLNRSKEAFVALLGPVFSLCFACVLLLIQWIYPSPITGLSMLFNLWIGGVNLIPFKIGAKHSDGFTVIQSLFKKE